MSGHSKWSTIKRKKETTDNARGKLFSKLSRAIAIAAKSAGPNPANNASLRLAIDAAKSANMPRSNIQKSIEKASTDNAILHQVTYEGFAFGAGVLIETATDNKNRTAQEIKHLLERGGGTLAGPGSVSFNFKPKGILLVNIDNKDKDTLMLKLIDSGVEDIKESGGRVIAFVPGKKLYLVKDKLEKENIKIQEARLVKEPITKVNLSEKAEAKLAKLVDLLENNEDVQDIFTNALSLYD